MDQEYADAYRELYQKHWWWRSRTELIVDKLRELQPEDGWKHILDVGCGDALFFERLSEFGEADGVEPCEDMVSLDNPYRGRIYLGPFDERFQPGKQYSLVLMLDVLEHLEYPAAALKHAQDLLAPDGVILVTVPAFMSLWTNHDLLNHHHTRYTKRRFRKVANESGLQIQEEHYIYQWTFPAKLGIRIMERISQPKPAVPKIPARWVNEASFWISRIEQRTLGLLSMPFGSSLMVVGTK